jgi:hypothetical protein
MSAAWLEGDRKVKFLIDATWRLSETQLPAA